MRHHNDVKDANRNRADIVSSTVAIGPGPARRVNFQVVFSQGA
jgi:hypothetical protein